MATLGASKEEELFHSAVAAPVRNRTYGTDDPARLAGASVISLLGKAPILAGQVVDRLCRAGILDGRAAGLADLQGFVALAIVYIAALSGTTQDGIKTALPLLSRRPFAQLWSAIPPSVRTPLAERRDVFFSVLNPAVGDAIHDFLFRKTSDAEWASRQAAEGLEGKMLRVRVPRSYGSAEQRADVEKLLTSFSRLDWLDGALEGQDLLTPDGILAKLGDSELAGSAKTYDKSLAVYLRGHGDTTNVKPVPGQESDDLAILENRNVTDGPMTFAQAQLFAMTYFKWLVSVRNGTTPLL